MSLVKLKIRTPCLNEGRDLEVDPEWTVGQLKELIGREWPSQPKPSDQRLIYAGKLLDRDCCVLSTILRTEMNDEHTLHILLKSLQYTPPTNTNAGLRHRTTAAPAASLQRPAESAAAPADQSGNAAAVNANVNVPAVNSGNATSPEWEVYQQQMAQYYARYIQYMQYYMQHHQQNQWNGTAAAPEVGHQQAQLNQGVAAAPLAAAALAAQLQHQQQHAAGMQGAGVAQHAPAARPAAPMADNVAPPDNLGNANNVMMNAGAAVGAVQEGDEEDGFNGGRRDIFDWFQVLFRVLVIFSVLYSYSSFSRFALIAMIAIIVYFYKSAVVGHRNPADLNHQRPAPNPQPAAVNPLPAAANPQQGEANPQQAVVNQQQVAVNQQQVAVNQQQQAGVEQEERDSDDSDDSEEAVNEEVELQPQLAAITARVAREGAAGSWYETVITFVTTFFTSIVPDNNDPQVF